MDSYVLNCIKKYEEHLLQINFLYLTPNINESKLYNAKKFHNLDHDEKIYILIDHTFFGSASESTLITNKRFSVVHDDSKPPKSISWNIVEDVQYKDDFFYFYKDSLQKTFYRYSKYHILHYADHKIGVTLSEMFREISKNFENYQSLSYFKIKAKYDEGNFEDTIKESINYIEEFGDLAEYSRPVRLIKSDALIEIKEFDKALYELDCNIESFINLDSNNYLSFIPTYISKGRVLSLMGKKQESIQSYQVALNKTTDFSERAKIKRSIQEEYNYLINNFNAISFQDRKVILIEKDLQDYSVKSFLPLMKSSLPNIQFAAGHPVEHELYIGHPYNPKVYIPIQNYEFELFMDKINEFCYLLQCLGAYEFEIVSVTGKEVESKNKSDSQINLDGGVRLQSASLEKSNIISSFKNSVEERKVGKIQKFSPKKAPYIPEDLIWYFNEPSWQRLFFQRVNGEIVMYKEIISTKQDRIFSNMELMKVKAEYKNLLVKSKFDISQEVESKFKESEVTEWEINVKFAPLENLI